MTVAAESGRAAETPSRTTFECVGPRSREMLGPGEEQEPPFIAQSASEHRFARCDSLSGPVRALQQTRDGRGAAAQPHRAACRRIQVRRRRSSVVHDATEESGGAGLFPHLYFQGHWCLADLDRPETRLGDEVLELLFGAGPPGEPVAEHEPGERRAPRPIPATSSLTACLDTSRRRSTMSTWPPGAAPGASPGARVPARRSS
jgi:hypothetical protein